ncbi:DUF3397 domain-containing protein [Lentibacillus sp. N15]|uniref:DUF3397 domain-containing protein n=1 Tax=Lentibacillus songyuanensis TaxID=3136161 RepID=UPI0031BBC53E
MRDFIINLVALIITVPIMVTFMIYYISRKMSRQKWRAVHNAVNWTTILYILAVHTLLFVIFNRVLYGWFIVFLLSVFSIILFTQWKSRTEVEFARAFKIFWRLSFLLFFGMYIALISIGLIQQLCY